RIRRGNQADRFTVEHAARYGRAWRRRGCWFWRRRFVAGFNSRGRGDDITGPGAGSDRIDRVRVARTDHRYDALAHGWDITRLGGNLFRHQIRAIDSGNQLLTHVDI